MITLITGLPGAGKTLWALNLVKGLADKEQREVYYNGIADLRLPWVELEKGEDWVNCPAGSIIVIDEAQRVFRPRGVGSVVPPHVALLETHRHRGVDLVLITQHPKLADSNVRRLVGRHYHVCRAFGTKLARVHEWSEVNQDPDRSRADSVTHEWRYPVESFSWYKSAEVHTHKARIPARVYAMLLLPLVFAGLVYGVYSFTRSKFWGEGVEVKKDTSNGGLVVSAPGSAGSPGAKAPRTLVEYVRERQPLLPEVPYSAAVYQDVVKVVDAPYPAGCVATVRSCRCYSQQGTRLQLPEPHCRHLVETGFFKDFETPADRERVAVHLRDVAVKDQRRGGDGTWRDLDSPGPIVEGGSVLLLGNSGATDRASWERGQGAPSAPQGAGGQPAGGPGPGMTVAAPRR